MTSECNQRLHRHILGSQSKIIATIADESGNVSADIYQPTSDRRPAVEIRYRVVNRAVVCSAVRRQAKRIASGYVIAAEILHGKIGIYVQGQIGRASCRERE